jgi:hypothetical protein
MTDQLPATIHQGDIVARRKALYRFPSVPHPEEAGRQHHLGRQRGGPALGKFGLVLQHAQTPDGLIFGIKYLPAPV